MLNILGNLNVGLWRFLKLTEGVALDKLGFIVVWEIEAVCSRVFWVTRAIVVTIKTRGVGFGGTWGRWGSFHALCVAKIPLTAFVAQGQTVAVSIAQFPLKSNTNA